MKEWAIRGLAQAAFMDVDEVAGMLVSTFAAALNFPSVGIEDLTLRSPSEVTGSAELMTDTAAAQEHRLAGP